MLTTLHASYHGQNYAGIIHQGLLQVLLAGKSCSQCKDKSQEHEAAVQLLQKLREGIG